MSSTDGRLRAELRRTGFEDPVVMERADLEELIRKIAREEVNEGCLRTHAPPEWAATGGTFVQLSETIGRCPSRRRRYGGLSPQCDQAEGHPGRHTASGWRSWL